MFTWQERLLMALGFKDAYIETNWRNWRFDRWIEGDCKAVDLGPIHFVYQV